MKTADWQAKAQFIIETDVLLSAVIVRIIDRYSAKSRQKDPLAGLPRGQLNAAITIRRIEPCCLSDLSRALHVSQTSASLMVDRLVERGLVLRTPDTKDRRRVTIRLEPRVKKYVEAVSDELTQWVRKTTRKAGPGVLNEWHAVLAKLRPLLESEGTQEP